MRIVLLILFAGFAATVWAADWTQFRGPGASSYSTQTDLPGENIADSIAWKAELPGRSVSGPIVLGGRVFVTSSGGPKDDQLYIHCLDGESGEQLWQRQFWATGRTLHHPTSATAAPTPVTDGEYIFAFFSSNDLICLDLEGNLQWLRGLTVDHPAAYNDTGMASSPVVVGEMVVVQIESFGDSFAAGLDKRSGETVWKVERKPSANWTSPVVLRDGDRELVLLQSSDRLSAHDPKTGSEVWSHNVECATISSATIAGDTIFLPAAGVTALRLGGPQPTVLWRENRLAPNTASPVVVGDRVYIINGAGVLVCGDTQTGNIEWQARLTGPFWATPVVAGQHLYALNQDGLLQVVRLPNGAGKGEVVATFELEDAGFGSPAIGDGAMFIRTETHLWKIAKR